MASDLEFVQNLTKKLEEEYKQTKRINPELKNHLIKKLLEFEGFDDEKREYLEDIGHSSTGENHDDDSHASMDFVGDLGGEAFIKASWKLIAILVTGLAALGILRGKNVGIEAGPFKLNIQEPNQNNPAPPTL